VSELPRDLPASLLASIERTPSPTRRTARALQWLVLPVGAIVAAALYAAYDGPEQGRGGRDAWFYVASALTWSTVAVLSLWGALGSGRGASWRSRTALFACALGTPAVLFGVMIALGSFDPAMMEIHPEKWGRMCLPLTLAAASLPMLALTYARRVSDPVHPALSGAALGSACGAAAGVMVELWCPVSTVRHIALGHILPILLLSLMAALMGAQMLGLGGSDPRCRGRRRESRGDCG
jgi:hypothetical protein